VKFLLTDDTSQYFRLLEVKTVHWIGQQYLQISERN